MRAEVIERPRLSGVWLTKPEQVETYLRDTFRQRDEMYVNMVMDSFESHPWREHDEQYLNMYKRILQQGAEFGFPEMSGHLYRFLEGDRKFGFQLDMMHPLHLFDLSSYLGALNVEMIKKKQEFAAQGHTARGVLSWWIRPEGGHVEGTIDSGMPMGRVAERGHGPTPFVPDLSFNQKMARVDIHQGSVERMSREKAFSVAAQAEVAFSSYGISPVGILQREIQHGLPSFAA